MRASLRKSMAGWPRRAELRSRTIATQFVSFRESVEDQQTSEKPKRKGERTHDRIKLAAIDLLNTTGYRDLKISDICEAAGITPPVLYIYYPSKAALTEEVLRAFLDHYMTRPSQMTTANHSVFESIYAANLDWLKLARVNGGLLRCLIQYSDETPEFAALFAKANQQWYMRVTRSILKRYPASAVNEAEILLTVHALGGMIDDLARRLYGDDDRALIDVVNTVAPDDETLAHFLSRLWMRTLYLTDPVDAARGGLAAVRSDL
jgi:TetR/AcrR family transcriptional regulator, transcriptional repressor for nem operon